MSDSWIKALIEPQKTSDVPLRPLKGIRRDVSSNVIPAGQFFDVRNLLARTTGLQRRAPMASFLGGATVLTPPVKQMATIELLNGTKYTAILDSKMLYYLTSAVNLAKSTYAVGTVTGAVVGGVTRLTGAGGTLWATAASDVKVGDMVYCSTLTGTNKFGIIDKINSDTQIDLLTNEGTAAGGSSYEVRRAIWSPSGHVPDFLVNDGKMIIVDGRRPPRSFDPASSLTAFGYYSADATYDLNPYAICFFKDRLFFGRTVETGGTEDNRSRVRWTTTLDFSVLPALQFVDKVETNGFIRRLVGLENVLMLYMSDALWAGRMTSYGDLLPVAFDTRIETGGMGLVADRGVLPFLGGHFLVMEDNIYFLNGSNLSLEPIGDPVKDLFFSDPDALWSVKIEADPSDTRILFTEPSISGGFERIFSFDYRSKEWTYEENLGSFLGRAQFTQVKTYDTWLTGAPYTYDTGLGIFPSYDSIGTPEAPRVYIGFGSGLRYYGDASLTVDPSPSGNILATIESGDFDYGELDSERIHLRLSVKLKEKITADLTFLVYTSTDEGSTWKQTAGRALIIKAGQLENFVNFRARGSTFRFKMTSDSPAERWTIKEIVMKAAGAGVETHLASND